MCAKEKSPNSPYSNIKRPVGRPGRDIAELVERIRSDLIAPNSPESRLPGVRRLANMYNVDHSRIDAALTYLVGKGVLTRRQSSGTYIAEPPEQRRQKWEAHTIGICFPTGAESLKSNHYSAILRGSALALEAARMNILLKAHPWDGNGAGQVVKHFDAPNLAGILAVGPLKSNLLTGLKQLDKPFVSVDWDGTGSGIPSFCFDNRHAGMFLAKRLAFLGHRRIVAIVESPERPADKLDIDWSERSAGFQEEWTKKNATPLEFINLKFRSDYRLCSAQIKKLLQKPASQRPTAVYAPQSHHLHLVWKMAIHLGLKVPRDLTLVSCDSIASDLEHSGIQFNSEKLGQAACEKLMVDIQQKSKPNSKPSIQRLKGKYHPGTTHAREPES